MNLPHRPQHPARRPSIGITPDVSGTTGDGATPRYELKASYAEAVLRAGGLPMVMPYSDDRSVVEAYLDRVQGVLVTGGAFDVPPQAYGDVARDGLGELKPGRTAFETEILRGALSRNLPVLGVCGGMQLLNVVLGGTLYQDIRRELADAREHEQKHDRTQPQHPIDIKPGTLLAELLGATQVMVNSTHHQAPRRTADGVLVSATAPDGVIEAIESRAHVFALGVQWHPELLIHSIPAHLGIYRGFVTRAREIRR